MPATLRERFMGSLLGGMLGDVIGAAVEGESPGYIRKTFRGVDDILALKDVEELFGGKWVVGRYTDDTQMSLCVAEWLLEGEGLDGKKLLEKFVQAYQPGRRYGPGTAMILEAFPQHRENWTALATMMFPQGSYGNGSAMRVGPVGLAFHNNPQKLAQVAKISSVTTHSHFLAVQGATLQATAVARAVLSSPPFSREAFLSSLCSELRQFESMGQDTIVYQKALSVIAQGLQAGFPAAKLGHVLGTGIKAQEAVPMAIYCFLSHPESYEEAIREAVFLGGDTDTIACMTGSISGGYVGVSHIPTRWLARVQEDIYTVERVKQLAEALHNSKS